MEGVRDSESAIFGNKDLMAYTCSPFSLWQEVKEPIGLRTLLSVHPLASLHLRSISVTFPLGALQRWVWRRQS